jgi:hypothetical protein
VVVPPFDDLASLCAWLEGFEPADRHRMIALLANHRTGVALAEMADREIYAACRSGGGSLTRDEVAQRYATTMPMVRMRVCRYRRKMGLTRHREASA